MHRDLGSLVINLRPVPKADELARKLASAPYLTCRRYLHRLMAAPRYPRFIYKFRTLRKVENPKPGEPIFTARSLFELRTVMVESLFWLSSPDNFNDPFDTWATWTIEGTESELRAHVKALGDQYASELTPEQREAGLQRTMDMPRKDLIAQLRGSFLQQRSQFGVCCFCAGDPRSVLMWSHYGGEHYGICLQFETSRDPMTLMRAIRVDYVDQFKKINWVGGNYRGAVGETFTSKHLEWRDEAEHRIIQQEGAGRYVRYDPAALTGIIFGCRADQQVKTAVAGLIMERAGRGYPPLKQYYVGMNEDHYRLDIWGAESGRSRRWTGRATWPRR